VPQTLRTWVLDLVALALGFGLASGSVAVVSAARRAAVFSPTVSLLAPTNGQFVSGTFVVSATASPDTATLQFRLAGSNLGPAITSGACTMSWNTAATPDGSYPITAVAFDGQGNSATSSPATVTVQNTPPQLSAIQATSIGAASAVITWVSSQPATSGVDFGPSGYSNSALDANLVTSHSVALASLSPSTAYHFRVNSRNAGGVQSTSQDQTFTTAASGAPTPPSSQGRVQGTISSPFGPIVGATVTLVQNGQTIRTTTSDATGHFNFSDVRPGVYQVWVAAGSFTWLFTTVTVS
jgi:hypothetical protein